MFNKQLNRGLSHIFKDGSLLVEEQNLEELYYLIKMVKKSGNM